MTFQGVRESVTECEFEYVAVFTHAGYCISTVGGYIMLPIQSWRPPVTSSDVLALFPLQIHNTNDVI